MAEFDKIPEVEADGEPTLGEVGTLINANFQKTLELFPQRNPATNALNAAGLPPKPQAELIEDVFDGLDGYDLASTVTLKLVIKNGKVQFVPDTGAAIDPAEPTDPNAPTALARFKSGSNTDPQTGQQVFVTGLNGTITSNYENSIDLFGLVTVLAGHAYSVLWRLKSKPAGSTAVFHGHGPGTPNERNVADTYLIGMDVNGPYEMELTVTDTVTGLTGTSNLTVTRI